MTAETKQRYLTAAAINTALAEEKPVQWTNGGEWTDFNGDAPGLYRTDLEWRIKPTPTVRPWTSKDVPPVCWVRLLGSDGWEGMIVGRYAFGVRIIDSRVTEVPFGKLATDYEWSLRSQGPFQPCTTTEP